ncbi:MAG: secondary thiamine-phosphate synthase enzyme YjbQ [Elusimicrobiales bacterium]|jgi:secondary thiamine-phosphate synthase enzyme|nr:secondary thiamine-phosphate synthase enzyme YjbQ [Elusimicrobiales bacterium]
MEIIEIKTNKPQEIIDITHTIAEKIKELKVKDGVCFIYSPHTTCGVAINEGADPTVKKDIINKLNKFIEPDDNYLHLEGNSHAHIKSVICGNSVSVFVENYEITLGRWQSVYLMEFDGPRNRELWIKIIN